MPSSCSPQVRERRASPHTEEVHPAGRSNRQGSGRGLQYSTLRAASSAAAAMAKRGAQLLRQLQFRYCDWGGSSKGIREYLKDQLPTFVSANPDVSIKQLVVRNKHPVVQATYVDSPRPVTRSVCVKNMATQEVQKHVWWLRNALPRSSRNRIIRGRHHSQHISIQGSWTVSVSAMLRSQTIGRTI